MGVEADFEKEKVANPVPPEPTTAPRPGFEPGSRAHRSPLKESTFFKGASTGPHDRPLHYRGSKGQNEKEYIKIFGIANGVIWRVVLMLYSIILTFLYILNKSKESSKHYILCFSI